MELCRHLLSHIMPAGNRADRPRVTVLIDERQKAATPVWIIFFVTLLTDAGNDIIGKERVVTGEVFTCI